LPLSPRFARRIERATRSATRSLARPKAASAAYWARALVVSTGTASGTSLRLPPARPVPPARQPRTTALHLSPSRMLASVRTWRRCCAVDRIVARYADTLIFVEASATSGDAATAAGRSKGLPARAVTEDASPCGGGVCRPRKPPLLPRVDGAGDTAPIRRSARVRPGVCGGVRDSRLLGAAGPGLLTRGGVSGAVDLHQGASYVVDSLVDDSVGAGASRGAGLDDASKRRYRATSLTCYILCGRWAAGPFVGRPR
jgi:hypothetical protein